MTTERWLPPAAEEPTEWQLREAGRYLDASREELARVLGRLTGGRAEAVAVTVERERAEAEGGGLAGRRVALGGGVEAGEGLAAALVSAALGYDEGARVEMGAAAEKAVGCVLAEAVSGWLAESIGATGAGGDDGPQVAVVVEVACPAERGKVAAWAEWATVWARTRAWLAATSAGVRVPAADLRVRVAGAVKGPALSLGELMALGAGDVLALPAGAEGRVALAVGDVPVAVGALGAVAGRVAVRVDKVAGGKSGDGKGPDDGPGGG